MFSSSLNETCSPSSAHGGTGYCGPLRQVANSLREHTTIPYWWFAFSSITSMQSSDVRCSSDALTAFMVGQVIKTGTVAMYFKPLIRSYSRLCYLPHLNQEPTRRNLTWWKKLCSLAPWASSASGALNSNIVLSTLFFILYHDDPEHRGGRRLSQLISTYYKNVITIFMARILISDIFDVLFLARKNIRRVY